MPLYLVAVVVVTDEREQMLGLLAAVHGCQHCSSGSGVGGISAGSNCASAFWSTWSERCVEEISFQSRNVSACCRYCVTITQYLCIVVYAISL